MKKIGESELKRFKFRSIADELELCRVTDILLTNKFHCSSFFDLNDPMEGIYTGSVTRKIIDERHTEKGEYKICSFSGNTGFRNPALWGYYTGGFYGVAIEVTIKHKGSIPKVNYVDTLPTIESSIETILRTKLNCWKHEDEFRYLSKYEESEQSIGKITAVYYGMPYSNVTNSDNIVKDVPKLGLYRERIEGLKQDFQNLKFKEVIVNEQGIVVKK